MKLNTMQYKGYTAKIEYDDDDQMFYGDVIDLRDTITFSGETASELKQGFERAVDAYLELCRERGEEPAKPYSGKVQLRFDEPADHRDAAIAAASCNMSLNQFIAWSVKRGVSEVAAVGKAPSLMNQSPVFVRVQTVLSEGISFELPNVSRGREQVSHRRATHASQMVMTSLSGQLSLSKEANYALTG